MFMKAFSAKNGAPAIGPYSPGVKLGDFVYLSGQLPTDSEGNIPETIEEQTHRVCQNMIDLLASMNLELRHVVKTTCFLANMDDFAAFNEVYASYFQEPYPARSCVEVSRLPKGAKVEIEALVIDTLVYEQQMQNHSCGGNCSHNCENCG